ncbi:MAG: O-antigen ligase family protein, partial [Acidobacteria bacterium]|nr:O-antigen ligase family protein [Acidobacteriota bacterium]
IFLFCLWAAVTSLFSGQPALSLIKAFAFLVLIAFSFLYAARFVGSPREATEALFLCVVILNFLFVLTSTGLHWLGLEITRLMEYGVAAKGMYGVFGNPNTLGTFVALCMPVLLWSINTKRRWRYPLMLLMLANVYCLFASRSRASIAAAVVGLGLYLFLRRPKLIFLYAYMAATVVLVLLAYSPEELSSFSQVYVFKGSEGVFTSRIERWKESLAYINEAWLFGYGLGTSPGVSTDWDWSFSSWQVLRVRGSSLLAAWEETGLVGLVLIMLTPVLVMGRALRFFQRRQRPRDQTFARIATLTGVLLVGLVNMLAEEWLLAPGYFGNVMFWMVVFLLAAELFSERRRVLPAAPSSFPVRPRPR